MASKKKSAIESRQGHGHENEHPSSGSHRGGTAAAYNRGKPNAKRWEKAVDKYWEPPVKIFGKNTPIKNIRYPKDDPKKNWLLNRLTDTERRRKAMEAQYSRYDK